MTGSSGFIGKALCEDLLAKGIKVWGISRSETSPIDHPNYKHFKHDVRKELLILFPVDTIFHLASPATSQDFWDKPTEVAETILIGTINITKYASKFGADLFFASSYGAENINPKYTYRDCYDVSKRAGETYIGDYPIAKLNSYIMRIPSVYGPGMPLLANKIVSNFIRYGLTGEMESCLEYPKEEDPLKPLEEQRTYIYIDDLLKQIIEQVENKVPNVSASGTPLNSFQVLHTILETTQGREPKCVMPRIEETINYFRDNLSTALTSLEKDQ